MNNGPARLIVKLGPDPGKEYLLTQPETTIGRSPGNTIVVANPEVSRRHARIKQVGSKYQIEDWGSTNGTFVAGRRIMNLVILNHEDEIQLGDSIRFVFLSGAGDIESLPREPAYVPQTEVTIVDASPIQPHVEEEPAPPAKPVQAHDAAEDEFILPKQEDNTSRNRLRLLGCGCLLVLIPLLCVGVIVFLDFYEQGRLLYCGPVRPLFEILLGPLGFSPLCP